MNVKQTILDIAHTQKTFKTSDVVAVLQGRVSRKWVSALISDLVRRKILVKSGVTAGATYALPKNALALGSMMKKHLIRKSIKEHEVLDAVNHQAPFLLTLNENLRSLFDYAFSEMLNNAIDHSKAKYVDIEVGINDKDLWFTVSDNGIGVFKNVMDTRHLQSELEAMQDLLKGKTTTQPHAHSGEGIFFTSKVADIFILESFEFAMRVDNTLPDVFFEERQISKKGTKVSFFLSKNTNKHLRNIFSKYETDHQNPDFDKTEVQIRLYTIGTIYVSRSQARRVLTGLEKFKKIILNFEKVPTVGQAFADEIFRVFQQKYPYIILEPINMHEAVKYMIDRVEKPTITIKQ